MIDTSITKYQFSPTQVPCRLWVPFLLSAANTLKVYGGTQLLTENTHYTLTYDAVSRLAFIDLTGTTDTTFVPGTVITMVRVTPAVPSLELDPAPEGGDPFPYESFEEALDRAVMVMQEIVPKTTTAIREAHLWEGEGGPPDDPPVLDPPIIGVENDIEFDDNGGIITAVKGIQTFEVGAITYGVSSLVAPVSNCEAAFQIVATMTFDPEITTPTSDQKTLFIGMTQDGQASTAEGAGFTIGPSDWEEVRPGLLSHLRELPVYFLPDDEDEAVIQTWAGVNPYSGHPADQGEYGFTLELLMKRYSGYGTNPTLRLTSTSAPVGGVDGYTGAGAFVLGTDTLYYGANPGGARDFKVAQPNPGQPVVDQWIINPWAAASVPVTLDIKGYGYAHTAPVLESITFVPYGDCGSIPPISWGVWASSPSFSSDPGFEEVALDGDNYGYPITSTLDE
jgi:hypothetical protein